MPEVLKKFVYSRKFWAFAAGLVAALSAAAQDGVFTADEIRNIVLLVAAYVASVAWEDGKHAEAAGQVAAAASQPTPPAVGIDANQVTVTPTKPTVGPTGLV